MVYLEENVLEVARPASIQSVELPVRTSYRKEEDVDVPYYPSPINWCGEVFYFLMVDRFSDGQEDYPKTRRANARPKFDRSQPFDTARPLDFKWDKWAEAGRRWQGGNLKGVRSKLSYLSELGITTLWLSPVLKQRKNFDDYHGYGIQNFLRVDPHFGTEKDLVDLIIDAHKLNIRVVLDVIINHTAHNWDYPGDAVDMPYLPYPNSYPMGSWLDAHGGHTAAIRTEDDGVWPKEFQRETAYTRAGRGDLGRGAIDDDNAEMRRTDFAGAFRDINLDDKDTLNFLSKCYKYWIALTDCDGFRIDTVKHISQANARDFCGSIKEFAYNLGKKNFFLLGEVAGSDEFAERYQKTLSVNLNATLDIGESRIKLNAVAKGLARPEEYFDKVRTWSDQLGSHRLSAERHVNIMDDHDCVCGDKTRFSTNASSDHQVNAGLAILLLSMGIPCVFYGSEQGFAGPENATRNKELPNFGGDDRYLRENMFGGTHSKKSGEDSLGNNYDTDLPAFGAFGTVGYHFFDTQFHTFKRVKELIRVRQTYAPLQYGRQYLRPIRNFGAPFGNPAAGELIAWSRILDEEEIVVIVNGHGTDRRGADILIDAKLNAATSNFRVILNTELFSSTRYRGSYVAGNDVAIQKQDGTAFLEIRDIGPSEVLILTNKP
jgi:glycosidase